MKELMLITSLLLGGIYSANAQKGKVNDVVLNPNKTVVRALPDLTFDLVPVLIEGNDGVQNIEGSPGKIKISINFIVKNIGLVNSKPSMVYAEYSFKGTQRVGTDIRESVLHVQSNPLPIPALERRKDILHKLQFTFNNTPEQVYGKDVKLRLVIVSTGTGSQAEISTKNNVSDEVTIAINR